MWVKNMVEGWGNLYCCCSLPIQRIPNATFTTCFFEATTLRASAQDMMKDIWTKTSVLVLEQIKTFSVLYYKTQPGTTDNVWMYHPLFWLLQYHGKVSDSFADITILPYRYNWLPLYTWINQSMSQVRATQKSLPTQYHLTCDKSD